MTFRLGGCAFELTSSYTHTGIFQYFCPKSHFQEYPLSAQPSFVPAAHVETATFPVKPRIPCPDLRKYPPDFAGARPRAAINPPAPCTPRKTPLGISTSGLTSEKSREHEPPEGSEPSGGYICRMRSSDALLTPEPHGAGAGGQDWQGLSHAEG